MSKANGIITDRIIASLEQGTVPWRKPWSIPDRGEFQNAVTGHRYRGINTVILAMTANAKGYTDPRWITFKQAKENGGNVRKGEKGTPVVFWNWIERENDDGDIEEIPFLRYYTVFNVEQCDDLDLPAFVVPDKPQGFDPLHEAESIARNMPNRPPVTHDGGDRAFYRPLTDSIHLPVREWFKSADGFYATLFHELGHSTGHPTRLNRKSVEDVAPFGSEKYSREELVAEFTSAFLCGAAGIVEQQLEQSAAYIASWLRALKNDDRAVVIAAAQAQKAADYILAGKDVGEPTPWHPVVRIEFPHHSVWEHIARQPVYAIAAQNLIRNLGKAIGARQSEPLPTYGRTGNEYLTPGKDHRRKPGKATFSGKGLAVKCTSIAYCGKPIRKPLTREEWAGVALVNRIAHALGARMFPERYALSGGYNATPNVGIFAPAFYKPAERCEHGEVKANNPGSGPICNDCRLAKAA